jgi:lambda family phage tail tape measure protein
VSDQIGKGVISFEADGSGLRAEMNTTADAVQNLGDKLTQTGNDGSAALEGISVSATEMSTQASAAVARFLDSLNRQTIAMEGGKVALLEYRAAQLGATNDAQQYFDRMRAVESQTQAAAAAQNQLNAAMTQAASDNAFLDSLKSQADTYGLTKTQLLEYQAAQRGLQAEASSLIARLAAQEQQTKAAAAAQQQLNDTMTRAAQDNAFLTSLNARANALGKTTSQLLAEQAAERGLSTEAAAAIAKLKAHEDATEAAGHSAEGFGLKTAGARKEVAVLVHELATGNIKNFGGSLLVLGERMDILGALFSPAALGIAAVVAGVGALAFAAVKGAEQQDQFNKAMQATAGFAGVTSNQLGATAVQIAALGVPLTKANSLLIDVVATGKISGQAIESVAAASALLAEATGQDAAEIVQKFAEMSSNVADGAAKMSEQYHFLTAAQYDEIKALQEHGNTQGALKVTADALTSSLEAQKAPLGTLPTILHEAAAAWSSFWQAAMNAGKPDTPTDRLNELREQLAQQKALLASGSSSALSYQIGAPQSGPSSSAYNYQIGAPRGALAPAAQAQQMIANLEQEIASVSRDAERHQNSVDLAGLYKRQEQAALDASIAVDKLSNSFDKSYEKQKALRDLQQQFTRLFNDPSDPTHQNPRLRGVVQNANGTFSGGEYDKLVKGINDRNKPSTAVDTATLNAQVKDVQDALKTINSAYQNSETLLEAAHNAGTISDAQFYQRQRDEIAKTANAQTAQLEREKTILEGHKASGAEQVRINQQIRDVEQQLQKVRDDTAAKFQKNVDAEAAALKKRKAAFADFQSALHQQLDTQQNGVDIQVASVGRGTTESQQLQQLNALQRSYDAQRTRIASQAAKVDPQSDQYSLYQDELKALQDANDRAIAITKDGFDRMRAAQDDWKNGATQAFENYADSASNIAGQVSSTFADAFRGMEDALVTFATTGKLSFSSFATSVIADIVRIQARSAISGVLGLAESAVGSYFGGGGAAAGAASGVNAYGFHLAGGGSVSGPGTSTSDSIQTWLSNGEYVINAAAVRRIGVANLDAINDGRGGDAWRRYASGGYVSSAARSVSGSGGNVVQLGGVTVQGGGDSADPGSGLSLAKNIDRRIRQVTVEEIAKANRQGGANWQIRTGSAR